MKKINLINLAILLFCFAGFVSAQAQKVEISPVQFNTDADDFGSVLSQNGRFMYFTTAISGEKQKVFTVERTSGGWSIPKELGGDVNDATQAGAVALTPDGQYMIFSAFEQSVQGLGRTDLFSARKIDGNWKEIRNLSELNSSEFDAQPTLSSDGQTLLFVSDRDGGTGGTDIYMSQRTKTGWTKPVNVVQLNSPSEEMTPVIAADNKTTYFASNRVGGSGGFDIYTGVKSGNSFDNIKNIQSPINTSADEYSYTSLANSTTAYFSRVNVYGDLDIMMAVPNPFPSEPVLIVEGIVRDASSKDPLGSDITITDLKTGGKVAELRSDDISGEYYATLTAGRIYSVTASKLGYVFYSERFEVPPSYSGNTITKNISLYPIANGSTRLLIFFDYNKSDLQDESTPELERIIEFLRENPNTKVSFEGHTDDVGTDDFNDKLSEKRANSVRQYLLQAGIETVRVKTKGFGKRKPLIENKDEDSRAQNRRVEMKITN